MGRATGATSGEGRTHGPRTLLPLAFGAAAGAGLIGAPAATAANFTVTNLNDTGAGSLRDALDSANSAPGADTILFQSGLSGTIDLASGSLYSYEPLTVDGPGSDVITLAGSGSDAVFVQYSNPGDDVAIDGLTLSGGYAVFGANLVAVDTDLTLTDVVSTDAEAFFGGGLVTNGGDLTIRDSSFTGNYAYLAAAGLYVCTDGAVDIDGVTISNNEAGGFSAGSLCAPTVNISDSRVTGNEGEQGTGGLYLYAGNGSIEASTFSGNTGGDDPYSSGGALTVYGDEFSIDRSTIADNSAMLGGGIAVQCGSTMTITRSTVSGNQAGLDGGGVASCDASLITENSTIANNTAEYFGGGISGYAGNGYELSLTATTVVGNTAAEGGGIEVVGAEPASLQSSLVADNTAPTGPNLLGDFSGNDNLVGPASGGTLIGAGNQLGVADPMLLPLADNGGPTQTVLADPDSPIVDAGSPSLDGTNDQRGLGRNDTDVGALEVATCRGVAVNRIGTNGDDVLEGTDGPDGIFGFAGDDVISGLGGDDGLCAGQGDDAVDGGDGADLATGNRGSDAIEGRGGQDGLRGGGGDDVITGNGGTDEVEGANGDDDLSGGPGPDDRVLGGNGSDQLAGGAGKNDFCNGNKGRNRAKRSCDIVKNAKVVGAASNAAAAALDEEAEPEDTPDAAAETDQAPDALELGEPQAVRPGGTAAE
jgi:hypothetical protein